MNRIILALLIPIIISCNPKQGDVPTTGVSHDTSANKNVIDVPFACAYENPVSSLGIGLVTVPEEFELFNDPALTSSFGRWNMYRDSITVCPKFFKPDYSIMHFVCVEVHDKAYKVLMNPTDTRYLPKEKSYRFNTWEAYILQSFGVRRSTNNAGEITATEGLKKEPAENAEIVSIPEGHEMFCPMEVQGDWIKVIFDCFYNQDINEHEGEPCHDFIGACKEPLTGWLRWRKDNVLLIDIFMMP